jgi:polyphenol oxidase
LSVPRRRPSLPPIPPVIRPWAEASVCHGFLGREGGVSRGPYATLNLSYWVGDNARDVDLNWQRTRQLMPPGVRVELLAQVHGKAIRTVGQRVAGKPRPTGDGLVTAATGVVLCVFSADCVPVLLADVDRGVVGALHAGWRGTLAGVAAAGVRAMVRQGARTSKMRASMGPAIDGCCYEVDETLAKRFAQRIPHASDHIRASDIPGKAYLHLRGIVAEQLSACGLARKSIQSVGPCTRCNPERYFSRRAADGRVTGLQLSFIGRIAV